MSIRKVMADRGIVSIGVYGLSLGDSIAFHDAGAAPLANGYIQWALALSGQRVRIPAENIYGYPGRTLEYIAGNIDAAFARSPVPPGFVVLEGGTNNMSDGVSTFESMKATMAAAIIKCMSYGARVIVLPVLPRTGQTTAAYAMVNRYNKWLREYAAQCGGLVAVASAFMRDLTDPALTGGAQPRTGVMADNTHPSCIGGFHIGRAIADILNTWFPPTDVLPVCDFAYDAANYPQGNFLTNGMLRYTAGGTLTAGTGGATNAGTVPDGWTATVTANNGLVATHAQVTSALTGMPMHQITFSGGYTKSGVGNPAYDVYSRLFQNVATGSLTGFQAGDMIEAVCAFEIDAASSNIVFPELELRWKGSSNFNKAMSRDGGTYRTVGQLPNRAIAGVLRTPVHKYVPSELPLAAADVGVFLYAHLPCVNGTFNPNGVVRFGQVELRKVEV